MVYFPDQVKGKSWKLARPYHGPYEVVSVTPTNVEVRLVGSPQNPAIFVALDRIRPCPEEMTDETWTGSKPAKPRRGRKENNSSSDETTRPSESGRDGNRTGPVTRSMARALEN